MEITIGGGYRRNPRIRKYQCIRNISKQESYWFLHLTHIKIECCCWLRNVSYSRVSTVLGESLAKPGGNRQICPKVCTYRNVDATLRETFQHTYIRSNAVVGMWWDGVALALPSMAPIYLLYSPLRMYIYIPRMKAPLTKTPPLWLRLVTCNSRCT